jgi:D-aminopeptidase
VTLEMSFKHYRAAELLAYLPIVTRVDAHTIRFTGRDILEVSRFIEFVNSYSPDITP